MNNRNQTVSADTGEVLVLTPDAGVYLDLLHGLDTGGMAVAGFESVDAALASRTSFQVILGRPDFAAAYLASSAGVRWVQSTWAGVTPLLELGRRDYTLTGVRGVFGQQVSEFVLGYLLAHELKFLERLGRQANRSWWSQPSGTLSGKTMGIMGTGSIGRQLAGMAAPFGLRVLGLNRGGDAVSGFEQVFPVRRLDDFLAETDYLVCTLPETPRTRNLFDTAAFRAVKTGCYLVNAGRGSVIDEKALLAALGDGTLSGAVLDVFREEPLPVDHPLWHAPETLVTAHVAAKSHPRDIVQIFLDNYRRFKRGDELKHRIDFDRGY